MDPPASNSKRRAPWNKGKLTGQKAPLRLKDVWAISSARPKYGVDGWAYMAGLLAAGTALLAGAAVLASRTFAIALVLAFLAAACLVPGVWVLSSALNGPSFGIGCRVRRYS